MEGGEPEPHSHQAWSGSAWRGCGWWPRSEKKGVPVAQTSGRGQGLGLPWEQGWGCGQGGNRPLWRHRMLP